MEEPKKTKTKTKAPKEKRRSKRTSKVEVVEEAPVTPLKALPNPLVGNRHGHDIQYVLFVVYTHGKEREGE